MARNRKKKAQLRPPVIHTKKIERDIKEAAAVLHTLGYALSELSPFKLNKRQREAIDKVLRHLDLENEYKLGNKLRAAFQVERDAFL